MYHIVAVDLDDPKDPLFQYCAHVTAGAKNMYNVANFYIRNLMTGLKKEEQERTPNEKEVLATVLGSIPQINEAARERYEKNRAKILTDQSLSEQEREKKLKKLKLKQFDPPTAEKWFAGYELLDAVFRLTENRDYRAVYSHIAQNAIKECVQAWESYFALKKQGEKTHIPRYKKRSGHSTAVTNNTGCRFENGRLVIPGTRVRLPLGNMPHTGDKIIQIRFVPWFDLYRIQIVTDDGQKELDIETAELPEDYGALLVDLGVRNFAAISDNKGFTPIVIKGGFLKSVNQQYNRRISELKSIQMKGHDPKTYHPGYTRQMKAVAKKRDRILRDLFYKIAHFLCRTAKERKLSVLIVGKNVDWKQECSMGKKQNQEFVMLPHADFIEKLQSVARQYRLLVILQEESYTSRSSFPDNDPIPDYGDPRSASIRFSGSRIKRGLYRSADGTVMNADVNGSCNIGRKYDPWIFGKDFDWRKLAVTTQAVGYQTFHPEAKGYKTYSP